MEEQRRAILDEARRICQAVIAPSAKATDTEAAFPHGSIRALAASGFLGLTIPVEFGGMGQGASTFAAVAEEVGRACASTGMVYVMHISAVMPILARATPFLVESFIRPIASGEYLATLAFSEFGTGAHFYAPASRVSLQDGFYSLNCRKSFVTSAGEADVYVVSTQSSTATSPLESDIFVVKRDTQGLSVAGGWNGLGMRGNASAPMAFEGCVVSKEHLLGREGDGLSLMLDVVLPWFQIGTSAVHLGVARAAFEEAVQHARSRQYEHTGTNLAAIPAVQRTIAEMRISLDTVSALLRHVASSFEAGSPDLMLPLLELKVVACDTAAEVCQKALKACGGAAFAGHLSVERHLRDSLAGSVMAPTSDVLKEFIGKGVLGVPLF